MKKTILIIPSIIIIANLNLNADINIIEKQITKEQNSNKFERHLMKQGLSEEFIKSKKININYSLINKIEKETFLTKEDIFNFLTKKVIKNKVVDLTKYSTLIQLGQSVKINLSEEDLNSFQKIAAA